MINGDDGSCDWESNGWRLPTEAEWEYLARGGEVHKYSGSNRIDDVAWYGHRYYDSKEKNGKMVLKATAAAKTHPVGQKGANGFGLYDMSGNVFEWCWDWKQSYSSGSVTDPRGASGG